MSRLRWLWILILAADGFSATSQVARAGDGSAPSSRKLLIVARSSDCPTLHPFVDHKTKVGQPSELVELESVLKNNKGVDDAEKLKRYLYNRWQEDKIGYVLLVGDSSMMPG